MKIIVSHDVDHFSPAEHCTDGILLKFMIRTGMELSLGRIRFIEAARRIRRAVSGSWNNIREIMDFDESRGIPATFFFGMARGLGMSYGAKAAAPWIQEVESRGFKTGVHGIEFKDEAGIREEKARFAELSSNKEFGIRMHYLRQDSETSGKLAMAGYAFDATPYGAGNPWKVGGMPVFPLHIMDGRYLQGPRFGVQAPNYPEILERTKATVRREADSGTRYFSLLFHDRYFSGEFETWKRWYRETIDFMTEEGYTFIGYDEAIRSL